MRREYFIVSAALFLTCHCVLGAHDVAYSDIEVLGADVCPEKDSCLYNRNANFSERNCECDRLCSQFNDCCVDADVPKRSITLRIQPLCMAYSNNSYTGAYAVAICPKSFVGASEVRQQCENDNLSDPLLAAPVTDTVNRVTYKNRYCAECNNASASLQSWLISVVCRVPNLEEESKSWQSLSYRTDLNRWGVEHGGQFHSCNLVFDKPEYITQGIRFCRPNLTSSCSSNWRRPVFNEYCKAYMAVVVDVRHKLYRNHHCALCNGVNVEDIICSTFTIESRKKKPFSFALLLDINRSDGNVVGVSTPAGQNCGAGQKYDPFFKKCRTLVCILPGYNMVNGRCVKG